MIGHQRRVHNLGGATGFVIDYEREHWYEWLWFRCYPDYFQEVKIARGSWAYVKFWPWFVGSLDAMYILFPLAPFVWAWRRLKDAWFAGARFCYRRKWLKGIKGGDAIHWFWPRYLIK
jgi:hypothetical protein